jgi:hypothetical protein
MITTPYEELLASREDHYYVPEVEVELCPDCSKTESECRCAN